MIQNTFRFPDDLYRRLREMSEAGHRSINAQALTLLDDALTAHGYPRDPSAAEEWPPPRTGGKGGNTVAALDAGQLADARRMIDAGYGVDEVAARFGVHRTTLWRHIGPTGRAPLTEGHVRQIKVRLAAGETQVALAREFGVSPTTIMRIKNGQTWRDVAAEPAEDAGK